MLKRKLLIICFLSSVLCALPLTGCAELQGKPRAQCKASMQVFNATVDSLTALVKAGKFEPQEIARLVVVIEQGQAYFDQWQASVKAGQARPDLAQAVSGIIDELLAIEAAKKGGDS